MPESIAIFGAGQGLGRAVARRYAQDGYDVVLVARRQQPLDVFAEELTVLGGNALVITADLADFDAIPALAQRVRAVIGELDSLYFAPTPDQGFATAAELTPERAQAYMPLIFYSQHSGAILTAQGASTVHGPPYISGPGPAQAAQRNYLQSLHSEVADKGIYVGVLYVGALIENSAFHAQTQKAKADGAGRDWGPTVNPAYLADVLWDMHKTKNPTETNIP